MDYYDKTARLGPAYLALLPLLILVVALFGQDDWWQQVTAVIVAAAVPAVLSDVIRQLGRSNQAEMFTSWGGVPTTQFLRHYPSDRNAKEENPILRAERHRHVTRVTGIVLPTAEEESAGGDALDRYDAAVALIRPHANQQMLVARENAHYGFWRNLYGLRTYVAIVGLLAVIVSVTLFTLDVCGIYKTSKPWLAIDSILGVSWLVMSRKLITESAVRRAANNYARELLQSLPLLPTAHNQNGKLRNDEP